MWSELRSENDTCWPTGGRDQNLDSTKIGPSIHRPRTVPRPAKAIQPIQPIQPTGEELPQEVEDPEAASFTLGVMSSTEVQRYIFLQVTHRVVHHKNAFTPPQL